VDAEIDASTVPDRPKGEGRAFDDRQRYWTESFNSGDTPPEAPAKTFKENLGCAVFCSVAPGRRRCTKRRSYHPKWSWQGT
jgi:hypothetical protein